MERPVFSISTSFYNRGKWVDHVYEGIKDQTYPYWEWVVTDDFSTEDSAEERLKEIAAQDPRVKYYTQSRKKEVFYNPNYGCSGNIVMQLDSDDTIYPKLLEIYAKHFSEDPELMGITCGHSMYQGDSFVSISAVGLDEKYNFGFAQMARAWRNVIPHFDLNGELEHYQNDTNIWRHVEARGKVMFLQRELYIYNYTQDSISKTPYTKEVIESVEKERKRIESKFPLNEDKCTFDLKFVPIERLSWAFYGCKFNKAKNSQNVLFIKPDIKPFEKQLLNELFYDHSIDYNVGKREKYDEIVMYLDSNSMGYVEEIYDSLQKRYLDASLRFFYDSKKFDIAPDQLIKLFVGYGWYATGSLRWGNIR